MRIKSKVAAAESAFHWQKWQATANKEKGKQARRGHHDVVPLRCDHTETITPPAWTAETLASASATGERQPRGRASRCSAARGRGAGHSQTQRASSCRAAAECVCLRVRREAFLLLRGHELSHGLIGIALGLAAFLKRAWPGVRAPPPSTLPNPWKTPSEETTFSDADFLL
jgi:hypothetical protein